MDFLTRAWAQLNDLFKSLTPGARIMAGLLLTLVVVSLVYLFQQHTSSPDAFLMGGEPFSATQLPAMEAAFAKAGLSGYEIDANRVRVPRGQQSVYMGALADGGALPPSFGKYLEKAVSTQNPWIGKGQQEQMIKIANQAELQHIISSMKGIEQASVLYDVEEKREFGGKRLVTASVSVKPNGSQPLEEERVPTLRHLVASAIAGLKPENVTVVDLNGRSYPGGGGSGSGMGGGTEDVYASRKRSFEMDWQSKIRNALSYIPGVVVTPNVELDVETSHEEKATTYDPKAVVYEQSENSNTKTMKSGAPGGRPGVSQQGGLTSQANQPAALGGAAGNETNEETANAQTRTAVPSKVILTTQHGLTPKRVTVTVSIPATYYEKIWAERNPAVDGQPAKKPDAEALKFIETNVKQDVEKTVVALLPPVPATQDPYPRVSVTSFQPIMPAPITGPTLPDKALSWLSQYWTTLGMTGVAMFSLVMLRGMVQSVPAAPLQSAPAEASPSLSLTTPDEIGEDGVEPQTARSRLKRRGASGPSLRDELAEIVKEDPDSAVAILRNWIGNAS